MWFHEDQRTFFFFFYFFTFFRHTGFLFWDLIFVRGLFASIDGYFSLPLFFLFLCLTSGLGLEVGVSGPGWKELVVYVMHADWGGHSKGGESKHEERV